MLYWLCVVGVKIDSVIFDSLEIDPCGKIWLRLWDIINKAVMKSLSDFLCAIVRLESESHEKP